MYDELVLVDQEQDSADFEGEKEDYKFFGVPLYLTAHFDSAFGELAHTLAYFAITKIMEREQAKERIQVLMYQGRKIWVVSNWVAGTVKEDYEHPEELAVVIMLPEDY